MPKPKYEVFFLLDGSWFKSMTTSLSKRDAITYGKEVFRHNPESYKGVKVEKVIREEVYHDGASE
jgi:hypothetical protein